MLRNDLLGTILPVVQKQWRAVACAIGDHPVEGHPEVVRVVDLKASPARRENMSKQGSDDMRDGLLHERREGHAEEPELEGDEDDVFALGVVQSRVQN